MAASPARIILIAALLLTVSGCTPSTPSTPSTPAEPEVTATPTERRTMSRAEFHDMMDDTFADTNLTDPDYDAVARTICDDFELRLSRGGSSNDVFNEMVAGLATGGPVGDNLDLMEIIEMSAWSVLYECPELADGADLEG